MAPAVNKLVARIKELEEEVARLKGEDSRPESMRGGAPCRFHKGLGENQKSRATPPAGRRRTRRIREGKSSTRAGHSSIRTACGPTTSSLGGHRLSTKAMKTPPASWADLWDPKYKGRRSSCRRCRTPKGCSTLFMAAHLETGKPIKEAQYEIDAGFKKLTTLKPNLLTVYTQMPQAINLLEQGEAWMIGGAFSAYTLDRKADGAPVDLAVPKEGGFVDAVGHRQGEGRPAAGARRTPFIDDDARPRGADQARRPRPSSLPTNKATPKPAGHADQASTVRVRSTGRSSPRTAPAGSSAGTRRWHVAQWPTPHLDVARRLEARSARRRCSSGVDLTVRRGEFVSLLGPSGCGKTTLLRIVAGLLAARPRQVGSTARTSPRVPPHRRDVGVVFQSYALFPHLTVAGNVAFGLKARGTPAPRSRAAVERALVAGPARRISPTRIVRRCPAASSSASRWRARSRSSPKLLLLDEPFSALDRKLRETMQIELRRLLRDLGTTAIFVTHDQDEALTMSDRIAVMNRAAIEQLADAARDLLAARRRLFALELRRPVDAACRQDRGRPPPARSTSRPRLGPHVALEATSCTGSRRGGGGAAGAAASRLERAEARTAVRRGCATPCSRARKCTRPFRCARGRTACWPRLPAAPPQHAGAGARR